MANTSALRQMQAFEFVRRLRESQGEPDVHYVLWLGAGCSVTSGIPAAGPLVRDQWLPRLHHRRGIALTDVETWAEKEFPGYSARDAAAFYGTVMEALFRTADDRQRETERLCDAQSPGFGYGVLAALMSRPDGIFSATITTNFDDLVADAMYVFGTKRPLVIQHEALASYARPGRVQRPLVVKIHGDHRLNPMHTIEETAPLKKEVASGIRGLLHDRGAIFIGYSGNDQGVVDALTDLPHNALPLGVWWVSRREPTGLIRPWLDSRGAVWVKADDFDELMLLVRNEFAIEHPTAQKFDRMFSTYRQTYEQLSASVEALSDSVADSRPLKEAAARASTEAAGWWRTFLEARRVEDTDPAEAEHIYESGLETDPDPRLITLFANFVDQEREDPDRAEALFERAITADPTNAVVLDSYAVFVDQKREDPDRAEALYERAITADPTHANNLGSYALFVDEKREDPDRAEALYERAITADPTNANNLGNYSRLLFAAGADARAESLAERALSFAQTSSQPPPVLVEVWMYRLLRAGGRWHSEAIAEIAKLLRADVRSPGWSFEKLLALTRNENAADIQWLEQLARVISEGAEIETLANWDAWPGY
ncbi:MAG TPA: tetratricopeptide repeat protein [Solirubrobacteraceae bacterium]|nr:tetratricopeptide repeat protein [Solirubrobacteraceae bacterium]